MSALLHNAYGAWVRRPATPVTPRDMDHPEPSRTASALPMRLVSKDHMVSMSGVACLRCPVIINNNGRSQASSGEAQPEKLLPGIMHCPLRANLIHHAPTIRLLHGQGSWLSRGQNRPAGWNNHFLLLRRPNVLHPLLERLVQLGRPQAHAARRPLQCGAGHHPLWPVPVSGLGHRRALPMRALERQLPGRPHHGRRAGGALWNR